MTCRDMKRMARPAREARIDAIARLLGGSFLLLGLLALFAAAVILADAMLNTAGG